ncbi:MAG: hypothetical protein WCA35_08215 [Kovacikia sp.]
MTTFAFTLKSLCQDAILYANVGKTLTQLNLPPNPLETKSRLAFRGWGRDHGLASIPDSSLAYIGLD